MRHYTWNGSGGPSTDEDLIKGYKNAQTGELIEYGDGGSVRDYDLSIPGYGGSVFGASSKRVMDSNNAFVQDQERDTGGSLVGVEEGRKVALNEQRGKGGERIANLVPAVQSRLG